MPESNWRPSLYEGDALPTELIQPVTAIILEGSVKFNILEIALLIIVTIQLYDIAKI